MGAGEALIRAMRVGGILGRGARRAVAGQHRMHRGQCGVVRDQVRVFFGRQAGYARQQVLGIRNHLRFDAGILQAHLHVVRAQAAREHGELGRIVRQLLEVDIPQPRHVAAIALLVVHEEGYHLVTRVLRHDLEVLIEAGGVLREVQQHAPTGDVKRLQAPVLRVEGVDGLLQRGKRATGEAGRGSGCQQVVHHVRAGVRRGDRTRGCPLAVPTHVERQPVQAQLHARCREVQGGTREPTGGTRERSQLPVLAIVVFQHGRAALAHLRVGHRILRQPQVLVHAERDGGVRRALGDADAQRVVGVVHQHRVRRLLQRAHDAVLDAVDLAHAVQLVAEQVEQHHVGGLQLRQDLRQPQLVALEHAPIRRAGVQQRRRHTRVQVRAGPVAHHALARQLKRVGQQVRHRGLSVRSNHAHRALLQLRREVGNETRIHVQRDFAREVRGGTAEHVFETPR